MSAPLWFFWGQHRMTFLRYMTLKSAICVHDDVRLIYRREEPPSHKVRWVERYDANLMPEYDPEDWYGRAMELPGLTVYAIEESAPEIVAMNAPDVQTKDMLEWKVLAEHGGTFADMDIVFLRTLPEITHDVQLVKFSANPKPGYIPVGFVQGKSGDVWRRAYSFSLERYDRDTFASCGLSCIIDALEECRPKTRLLDERIVFPWAGDRYPWLSWHSMFFGKATWPEIPNQCIGIHWYGGRNGVWNMKINGPSDMPNGAVRWAVEKVLEKDSST